MKDPVRHRQSVFRARVSRGLATFSNVSAIVHIDNGELYSQYRDFFAPAPLRERRSLRIVRSR
jgi:hypothetical protein